MGSYSNFTSSDDESRNDTASRKRRKIQSGERHRGSKRGGDYHRGSSARKNERRSQVHSDNKNNRHQRKRRLEHTPPRREDPLARHPREEDSVSRRGRYDSNHNHQNYENRHRDDRDRRQNKSSFEQAKLRNEASPVWGGPNLKNEVQPQEKEKPNFEVSGKLAEDTNMVNGVLVKYSEPSDAKQPQRKWRLYQFKGEREMPTLYLHRQSGFLLGRDRKVADIPIDHPSCSKQHAALQFRLVPYNRDNGTQGRQIRPYIIDLESANGTFINGVKLEPRRYHELLERDVIKFGFSSREYVLLHEESKNKELDDDLLPTLN